ncbi:uncharacterized protein BCR38DRAFT_488232 [Pseudomassariella vexata]|uniref:Uncharacterized protein n=1 Tax=Pseudomassariella vexata TaxID=1141098 RepID=A0A1Y2DLM5_9PEZI|nr:uncharacterized protein BCR38DRAFT_488232 [Pseudomassariella vexata]ORY60039.1 hypothetical protein BCR38DRAFT_488232 [Pseudomassariella vexata]
MNCASKNCKVPLTLFREDKRTEVISKFCHQHTCNEFFKTGCDLKKMPHDVVCYLHIKCRIIDCTNGRLQYLDDHDPSETPQYQRESYCADHKFPMPQCPEPKARTNQGQFYAFCTKHKWFLDTCRYEGCVQRSLEGRDFCPKHKCANSECPIIVVPQSAFCVQHGKCMWPGCNGTKPNEAHNGGYSDFCRIHLTCNTQLCNEVKIKGSLHCVKHTCLERDCEESTGSHQFCDNHRCEYQKCEHAKAWLSRGRKNNLCALHNYRSKNCQLPVSEMELYRKTQEVKMEKLCLHHFTAQLEEAGGDKERVKSKTQIDKLTMQLRDGYEQLAQHDRRLKELESHKSKSAGWFGA